MKKKINLRLMADYLGAMGVFLIALSGDTFAYGDISFATYLCLLAKLAIPLYIRWGILIYLKIKHILYVREYNRQKAYERQQRRLQRERDRKFREMLRITNEFYERHHKQEVQEG